MWKNHNEEITLTEENIYSSSDFEQQSSFSNKDAFIQNHQSMIMVPESNLLPISNDVALVASTVKRKNGRERCSTCKAHGRAKVLDRSVSMPYKRTVTPAPKVCINPEILRIFGYHIKSINNRWVLLKT